MHALKRDTIMIFAILGAGSAVGCRSPQPLRHYPPNALQVRYESAGGYSGCLTASVAMAANYVLGEYRLSEKQLRRDLQQAGFDETRAGDVKQYLGRLGLHLVTLAGSLDGKPPLSLRYWVLDRGYPVICVINTYGSDPDFNHAVVVVGFSKTGGAESADSIYYLDPSSAEPLHKVEAAEFERVWARSGHAMMVVVQPPGSQGGRPH